MTSCGGRNRPSPRVDNETGAILAHPTQAPRPRLAGAPRYGEPPRRRRTAMLSSDLIATLRSVSTATVTTILLKKGVRRTWMQGPKPLQAGYDRIVGPAFTLRFVPAREDLATPRVERGLEDMPEGAVAVADAMGVTGAGI